MFEEIMHAIQGKAVTLVIVSKTQPQEKILHYYAKGHRAFGENRVPELQSKQSALPKDIQWHFIGSLQTNKVKALLPHVYMIHSIDSQHLLEEVNKQAARLDTTIRCLLQFKIAQEETKSGMDISEAEQLLNSEAYKAMQNIKICGVMGMGSFTEDESLTRKEFRTLKSIFDHLKRLYFADQESFVAISMGMSGDWDIALEEGSTMLRVGSALF